MKTLEKIIWTNNLSIGNPNIDKDHKKIFEAYNDLVDLIKLNGSREGFAEVLSKMTDYALIHLKKEEEYMEKFAYPELTKHKECHQTYMYKVAMYNHDLLSISPPDPKDIIEFLEKWWTEHILISDADYENYRKKIQADVSYNDFYNYY